MILIIFLLPETLNPPFINIPEPSIIFETEILCKLVYYEARGEPFIGKLFVAQVAINKSIRDSISLDSVVKKGFNKDKNFYNNVIQSDLDTTIVPYIGAMVSNPLHNYYYFYNPKTATDKKFIKKMETKKKFKINNHVFF